jgi:hypothetical protein
MKLFFALARCLKSLTHHYSLHAPEHVGTFAGAYLERRDWDHL